MIQVVNPPTALRLAPRRSGFTLDYLRGSEGAMAMLTNNSETRTRAADRAAETANVLRIVGAGVVGAAGGLAGGGPGVPLPGTARRRAARGPTVRLVTPPPPPGP